MSAIESSGSLPTSLRLFVALLLPSEWEEHLVAVQRRLERLSPGYMRWVRPGTLHLTLVFLGNQPRSGLDTIVSATERAASGVEPFRIALGAPGTFGSARAPRVVWLGIQEPSGALQKLHQALVAELNAARVSFDERELRPHITLGRARSKRELDGARWTVDPAQLASSSPQPYSPTSVSLMLSELRRDGPRYSEMFAAPLRNGRASVE